MFRGRSAWAFLIIHAVVLIGTAQAQVSEKKRSAFGTKGASSGSRATRAVPVKYGSIIEAEFTASGQQHEYTVQTSPGDKLKVMVQPVGDTLLTVIGVFDPTENIIISSNPRNSPGRPGLTKMSKDFLMSGMVPGLKSPAIETPPLSARGGHTILVTNGERGNAGVYQLFVGATLRDGTEIEPGGAAEEAASTRKSASKAAAPAAGAFSGRGFPGLPPVDFADAITIDLPNDGVARGGINSSRDSVVRAFRTTPKGKSAQEITLTRTKGTFSLGLVVLSGSNDVLAQASLVTGSQVSARVTVPAGAITIGVYRLDLGKDPGTGPTEFEIKAKPAP